MTELEKGTVKAYYTFYFGDREDDYYIKRTVGRWNKVVDNDFLKKQQEDFINYLNYVLGGNFEPVTYQEYIQHRGGDD